jgi:hypothetical protein
MFFNSMHYFLNSIFWRPTIFKFCWNAVHPFYFCVLYFLCSIRNVFPSRSQVFSPLLFGRNFMVWLLYIFLCSIQGLYSIYVLKQELTIFYPLEDSVDSASFVFVCVCVTNILFLLSNYCCAGGTVWHLQKCSQYILV